jgi:hypothetical protein
MYTGNKDKDGNILDPPRQKGGRWDVDVDGIDDVPTKVALIAHLACQNVCILSCVGVGGKADPPRIHVLDLKSVGQCPRSWDRHWLPWHCVSWGGSPSCPWEPRGWGGTLGTGYTNTSRTGKGGLRISCGIAI